MNMADGQYERSVVDALTFGIEPITDDEEVKEPIQGEMLLSILEGTSMPMDIIDEPLLDDLSDLGSLVPIQAEDERKIGGKSV